MSDPEGFLSRWSRRKREADEPATEAEATSSEPGKEGATPDAEAAPPQAENATPAVDLTKLPPLESITAGTDIRDFFAAGVPEALKRAALRRAWAADPAIRDFVGLSENAWDFTAPDSIHGFGPMLPTDDVAGMVADLTGRVDLPELRSPDADASLKSESCAQESGTVESRVVDENRSPPPTTKSDNLDESNSSVSSAPERENSAGDVKTIDIAMQNDPTPEPQPVRRGHGGALPQ